MILATQFLQEICINNLHNSKKNSNFAANFEFYYFLIIIK